MPELIRSLDADFIAQVRTVRERLHRKAEVGFAEHETAAFLVEQLEQLPLERLVRGVGGTGLVAVLTGRGPGRVIAVRAELDGLPLTEKTGLPYASQRPGAMHACGHDGHMAISIGLARWFAEHKQEWDGTLKFIFQPSEEEGAGARMVVSQGVLRDPDVEAILAVHARPQIKAGQIELADIPSAAADGFDVRIQAQGCHGAYPHLGIDAVLIASHVVVALQAIVARQVAPADAAVVTIGALQAGRARNVIAASALLEGTLRTRSPQVRERVLASIERIATNVAAAFGGQAAMELKPGYPRVRNDPALLDLVRRLGVDLFGRQNVLEAEEATMGADDFSYYLSEQGGVPGCIVRLGVETDQSLHSDGFDFGHQGLEPGILLLANVGLALLAGEGRP